MWTAVRLGQEVVAGRERTMEYRACPDLPHGPSRAIEEPYINA